MARKTCAHCEGTRNQVQIEWNPLEEVWQCRDVVRCAKTVAERKLLGRLSRVLREKGDD